MILIVTKYIFKLLSYLLMLVWLESIQKHIVRQPLKEKTIC